MDPRIIPATPPWVDGKLFRDVFIKHSVSYKGRQFIQAVYSECSAALRGTGKFDARNFHGFMHDYSNSDLFKNSVLYLEEENSSGSSSSSSDESMEVQSENAQWGGSDIALDLDPKRRKTFAEVSGLNNSGSSSASSFKESAQIPWGDIDGEFDLGVFSASKFFRLVGGVSTMALHDKISVPKNFQICLPELNMLFFSLCRSGKIPYEEFQGFTMAPDKFLLYDFVTKVDFDFKSLSVDLKASAQAFADIISFFKEVPSFKQGEALSVGRAYAMNRLGYYAQDRLGVKRADIERVLRVKDQSANLLELISKSYPKDTTFGIMMMAAFEEAFYQLSGVDKLKEVIYTYYVSDAGILSAAAPTAKTKILTEDGLRKIKKNRNAVLGDKDYSWKTSVCKPAVERKTAGLYEGENAKIASINAKFSDPKSYSLDPNFNQHARLEQARFALNQNFSLAKTISTELERRKAVFHDFLSKEKRQKIAALPEKEREAERNTPFSVADWQRAKEEFRQILSERLTAILRQLNLDF